MPDTGAGHLDERRRRRADVGVVPVRPVRLVDREVVRRSALDGAPRPHRQRVALRSVARARDRRAELLLERARRRPGQPGQVLVVCPDAPVEDGVGRVGRVARVGGRVGEDVVERRAEGRVGRDLEPVAARAEGRRPAEGRLVEEGLNRAGREQGRRRRLLLERALGRVRQVERKAVTAIGGRRRQNRPVEGGRLVGIGRRLERGPGRVGRDASEALVDHVAEVRVLRDDDEVAVRAEQRLPGEERRARARRPDHGLEVVAQARVAEGARRGVRAGGRIRVRRPGECRADRGRRVGAAVLEVRVVAPDLEVVVVAVGTRTNAEAVGARRDLREDVRGERALPDDRVSAGPGERRPLGKRGLLQVVRRRPAARGGAGVPVGDLDLVAGGARNRIPANDRHTRLVARRAVCRCRCPGRRGCRACAGS